jgi:ferredoxin
MLHGLLQGDVEASEYLAEKIFECYSCKRCDATCSAKVDVTEIFNDAKADLVESGFDVYGTTSRTDDDLCCLCQICISTCKHEARSFNKDEEKVVVDRVKCQSCGCCVAACPTGAAYSKEGFKVSQNELLQEVVSFLEGEVE